MADIGIEIQGTCSPGFEKVRDAFAWEFAQGNELGASLAITLEDEMVVDLWAGHMDKERTRPWKRDTLANVYSTTKGILALAAHRLIDEGLLDLDAPVATWWPGFAAAGKAELPFRYLLSHQAGLAAIAKPLAPETLFDWEGMCAALAQQEPWWAPGTAHGYHAVTFGWLVGEVVRRIRGKRIGDIVREEIAGPLDVEFEIGFGPELDERVASLVQGPVHPPGKDGPGFDLVAEILAHPESLLARTYTNPPLIGLQNRRAWRAAEIPAANGHTNARSLARIYAALANGGETRGVRLLSKEAIERARVEQVCGEDRILPVPSRIALGFFLPGPGESLGPNDRVFGHGGAGGSYGQADPENRLSFGYVMNRMHQGAWLVDPRARRLLRAAYACLGM
ncbi:MAG TPA: class A beta-lactamase-related serine hydrolase [Deltaproteobacteria bacterium]|nr:class A beta-lactamase-related serine hydrolase [Deltaproteobacteria bacterium]